MNLTKNNIIVGVHIPKDIHPVMRKLIVYKENQRLKKDLEYEPTRKETLDYLKSLESQQE